MAGRTAIEMDNDAGKLAERSCGEGEVMTDEEREYEEIFPRAYEAPGSNRRKGPRG